MGSAGIPRTSYSKSDMRLLIASLFALCFWSGTITVIPRSSTHQLPEPVPSVFPSLLAEKGNRIKRVRASTNPQTCQIQEASLMVSWGLADGVFLQWFTDGRTFQVEGSSSWNRLPGRVQRRLLLALECVAAQNTATLHFLIPGPHQEKRD